MATLGAAPQDEDRQLGPGLDQFAARRARVFDAIGQQAFAVLQGAPAPRGFPHFRQSNEFYYLSGIEVPHAYLLLNGRTRTTTLYLPHRDERHAANEGETLCAEDSEAARQRSGVEAVAGPERLAADLAYTLVHQPAPVLYTPAQPAEGAAGSRDTLLGAGGQAASDPWDGTLPREGRFTRTLQARFPQTPQGPQVVQRVILEANIPGRFGNHKKSPLLAIIRPF